MSLALAVDSRGFFHGGKVFEQMGEAFLFAPFVQSAFVIGKLNAKTPAAPVGMGPDKLPDAVNITWRNLPALYPYQFCTVMSHAVQ